MVESVRPAGDRSGTPGRNCRGAEDNLDQVHGGAHSSLMSGDTVGCSSSCWALDRRNWFAGQLEEPRTFGLEIHKEQNIGARYYDQAARSRPDDRRSFRQGRPRYHVD